MVIYKKDIIKVFIVIIVIIGLLSVFINIFKDDSKSFHIGGFLHKSYEQYEKAELIKQVLTTNYDFNEERFQRPSKQPTLRLKYNIKSSTDFDRWYECVRISQHNSH